MSKRQKKPWFRLALIVLAAVMVVAALATTIVVHVRDNRRDNRDKTQLAQAFSKVALPANLHLQSSSFQIADYSADPLLGLSGQTPEWTYDYTVVGDPASSVGLAAAIAADLQRAGYTINNQQTMDELPNLDAAKNNGDASVTVTFNHTINAADHPLSQNYTVKSVTLKVDGKERSEPVSY